MKPILTCMKRQESPKGSVLLYTIVMLLSAGMAVAAVMALVVHNLRDVRAAESRLRAFYAAETGVEQVKDWFNRGYYSWIKPLVEDGTVKTVVDPETLHTWEKPGTAGLLFANTEFQNYFTPWTDTENAGQFINKAGSSSFGRAVGKEELVIDFREGTGTHLGVYLPVLKDPATNEVLAKVTYLKIKRPPDGSGLVARLTVLGINPSRAQVTVEADLQAPWIPEIFVPASLMGRAGVASNGQINVNWGEVWVKNNYVVTKTQGTGALPNRKSDKWIKVLSEANILNKESDNNPEYCDGLSPGGVRSDPIPPGHVNYHQPYKEILSSDNKARAWSDYADVLWNNQTLEWPTYEYDKIKSFVISQGWPVYRTTADGSLIGPHPQTGVVQTGTFDSFFNVSATFKPDDIDWDVMPPLYFIDTTDGNAPKADGSNVVTLKDAGNSPFYYGMFFLAANIEFAGAGNPPTLSRPEQPDRTIGTRIKDCRLAGLLYSYGTIGFQGTGDMYGAIYADKGFQGGGGWELYYDWRMADPLRNATQPRIIRAVWDTYHGIPNGL